MKVVETDRFLKDARPLMPESERMKLVAFIAIDPKAGDLIPETGGVRKLRWALPGKGKRGGARVIYYFHSEQLPVFLLAAYGKNEKANIRPVQGGRHETKGDGKQASGRSGKAPIGEEAPHRRKTDYRRTGTGCSMDTRQQ
jgi:hypothetical protein